MKIAAWSGLRKQKRLIVMALGNPENCMRPGYPDSPVTIDDLMKETAMELRKLRRHLRDLIKQGLVDKKTAGKKECYILTHEGEHHLRAILRESQYKSSSAKNICDMRVSNIASDTAQLSPEVEQPQRTKIVLRPVEATTQIRESSPYAPEVVIGMDIGDKDSRVCVLQATGTIREETSIPTTEEAIRDYFTPEGLHILVVIEAGNQSVWINHLLEELGYEVLVARPSRLRDLYRDKDKSDCLDARRLAQLGYVDPNILAPVTHLKSQTYADRCLVYGRDHLVTTRTKLINFVRGQAKTSGNKIPTCKAVNFHSKARKHIPENLTTVVESVLTTIEYVTKQIAELDKQIEGAAARYPIVERLCDVPGIAVLTAMAFVLAIEDPLRFQRSDTVAAYLGLVPRKHQSGSKNTTIGPGSAGDSIARRYLIQAAQYHLWNSNIDSSIQRAGLRIMSRGGEGGKSKAVFTVARKLAVLLHTLWVTGSEYEPLHDMN